MKSEIFLRSPLRVEDTEIKIEKKIINGLEVGHYEDFILEKYGKNTPGVYCFFDYSSIYIGESLYPHLRLLQHRTGIDAKMSSNSTAWIYSSDQFDKSSIFYIEGELIQMADAYRNEWGGNWKRILNLNRYKPFEKERGKYFLDENYRDLPSLVWDDWEANEIVNKKAKQIYETWRYKLSPYKSLNSDQEYVAQALIENWKNKKLIVVKGFPGTGKSVLAGAIFNSLLKQNVCLTACTENTFSTFSKVFRSEVEQNQNAFVMRRVDLFKLEKGKPDLVIVDEGHRLLRVSAMGFPLKTQHIRVSGYENELEMLMEKFEHVIIFYDSNQVVHDADFLGEEAFEKYSDRLELKISIQERLSAEANEYVDLTFNFLDGENISSPYKGKYPVNIFDNFSSMHEHLKKVSESQGSPKCAILSGNTRPWLTNPRKKHLGPLPAFDFEIDDVPLIWNTTKDWFMSEGATSLKEVGYFTTVQGTETDYTGVIIGNDLIWDESSNSLKAVKEYVVNKKELPRKKGLSKEKWNKTLLKYIVNRYKILLTRATKGTSIYIENLPLRKKIQTLFCTKQKQNTKLK